MQFPQIKEPVRILLKIADQFNHMLSFVTISSSGFSKESESW